MVLFTGRVRPDAPNFLSRKSARGRDSLKRFDTSMINVPNLNSELQRILSTVAEGGINGQTLKTFSSIEPKSNMNDNPGWLLGNKNPESLKVPKYRIHPLSRFRTRWDWVVGALIVYSTIVIPAKISFEFSETEIAKLFDLLVDILFMFDIFINFATGYIDSDHLFVWDWKKIAKRYFKSWFIIDFFSTIPLDYIIGLILKGNNQNTTIFQGYRLLKVLRLIRLLKLARLLKLSKLAAIVANLEEDFDVNLGYFRIFKLSLIMIYISHLVGCLWFFFASLDQDDGSISWYTDVFEIETTTDITKQYTTSIYWAISTMTTVGYGDVFAKSIPERYFSVAVMIIGTTVFGYVIGNISYLVDNSDVGSEVSKENEIAIKNYCRHFSLPFRLKLKVLKHFEYIRNAGSVIDVKTAFPNLPECMRNKLVLDCQYSIKLIKTLHLFDNRYPYSVKNRNLHVLLLSLLTPMYLKQLDLLYEQGDLALDLYFIVNGSISEGIYSDSLQSQSNLKDHDDNESSHFTLFKKSDSGTAVGAGEAMRDSVRLMSAVATEGYTSLLFIRKLDFINSIMTYDNESMQIFSELSTAEYLERQQFLHPEEALHSSDASMSCSSSIISKSKDAISMNKFAGTSSSMPIIPENKFDGFNTVAVGSSFSSETYKEKSNLRKNNDIMPQDPSTHTMNNIGDVSKSNASSISFCDSRSYNVVEDISKFSIVEIMEEKKKMNSSSVVETHSLSTLNYQRKNSGRHTSRKNLNITLSQEELHNMWLIQPEEKLKVTWDVIICMFIFYSVCMVPYRIGFGIEDILDGWLVIDIIIDVSFAMDMIASFRTCYFDMKDNTLIYDVDSIRSRYLKGWFFIDLVSTVPFDVLGRWLLSGLLNVATLRTVKLVRAVRLIKLLKLLRLLKFKALIKKYKYNFEINTAFVSVVKLLLSVMFCAHLSACLLNGAAIYGTDSDIGSTWISDYCQQQTLLPACNGQNQYSIAIYFSITTISTVGYGDITPNLDSSAEVVFAIIAMLVGTIVFAFMIGEISILVRHIDPTKLLLKSKLKLQRACCNEMYLPKHVKKRQRIHLENYIELRSSLPEKQIIYRLPARIATKVLTTAYRNTLLGIDVLKCLEKEIPGASVLVLPRLFSMVFMENEIIYDSTNNSISSAGFVVNGTVEMIAADGFTVLERYEAGCCFAEIALIVNQYIPFKLNVTYRCSEQSSIAFLEDKSIHKIASDSGPVAGRLIELICSTHKNYIEDGIISIKEKYKKRLFREEEKLKLLQFTTTTFLSKIKKKV